jgi:hypothetical protein
MSLFVAFGSLVSKIGEIVAPLVENNSNNERLSTFEQEALKICSSNVTETSSIPELYSSAMVDIDLSDTNQYFEQMEKDCLKDIGTSNQYHQQRQQENRIAMAASKYSTVEDDDKSFQEQQQDFTTTANHESNNTSKDRSKQVTENLTFSSSPKSDPNSSTNLLPNPKLLCSPNSFPDYDTLSSNTSIPIKSVLSSDSISENVLLENVLSKRGIYSPREKVLSQAITPIDNILSRENVLSKDPIPIENILLNCNNLLNYVNSGEG